MLQLSTVFFASTHPALQLQGPSHHLLRRPIPRQPYSLAPRPPTTYTCQHLTDRPGLESSSARYHLSPSRSVHFRKNTPGSISTCNHCKVHSHAATPRTTSHRIVYSLTNSLVLETGRPFAVQHPSKPPERTALTHCRGPCYAFPGNHRQFPPPSRSSNQKVATLPSVFQSTVSILHPTYPDRLFYPCNIALCPPREELARINSPHLYRSRSRPPFGLSTRTTSSATRS